MLKTITEFLAVLLTLMLFLAGSICVLSIAPTLNGGNAVTAAPVWTALAVCTAWAMWAWMCIIALERYKEG